MINAEELLFVVDENNEPLEPQTRKYTHANLLWHRTTDIWVINRKGEVLCQKRSLKKDVKPGFWEAFFGGHLAPHETYLHNAVNELHQELGIEVTENDLIPYKVFKSDKPTHKEFPQNFAMILDRTDLDFNFEKDEVDALEWKKIEEVKKILVEDKDPAWVLKPWDEKVLTWLPTLL